MNEQGLRYGESATHERSSFTDPLSRLGEKPPGPRDRLDADVSRVDRSRNVRLEAHQRHDKAELIARSVPKLHTPRTFAKQRLARSTEVLDSTNSWVVWTRPLIIPAQEPVSPQSTPCRSEYVAPLGSLR